MPLPAPRHWINGDGVAQGDVRATRDVFTGKDHRRYHSAGADIAERAIESARQAFEHSFWAHQPRQRYCFGTVSGGH